MAALDGLDDIDWASFRHAYGSAENVPDLIRGLASTDPGVVAAALDTLTWNIVHQGTRYTASAVAAPFLCALAGDGRTLNRPELVEYLSYLAVGYCEGWVRDGFDADAIRTQQAQWTENRFGVDIVGGYDAICASIDPILSLVGDSDPRLRRAAGYLLGCLPDLATRTLPVLADALSVEAAASPFDETNVANLLLSIGLLAQGRDDGVDWLQAICRFAEPDRPRLVRLAATIGRARLEDPPDVEVVAILLDAIEQPPDPADLRWNDGDLGGLAAIVLERSVHSLTPEMTGRLLDAFSGTAYLWALTLAIVLLRSHFLLPGGPPENSRDLTADQRRVLEVFAENGDWTFGNFALAVRDFGLPMTREQVVGYLEGTPLTECRPRPAR